MTLSEAILRVLRRGPRKGLTANTISDRLNAPLGSTRTTISALKRNGQITVVGTESREFRPAQLYAITS